MIFSQTHLFVREEANVQASNSNEDDFIHNMRTLLGEMRAALVVLQAGALLKNPGSRARKGTRSGSRSANRRLRLLGGRTSFYSAVVIVKTDPLSVTGIPL